MVAHTLILALGRRKHEMIWLGRVRKWYGGAETGARPPFDWGVGEVRNGCGLLLCFSDLSALIPWFLTLGLYGWDQLEFVLHCIGYVFLIAVTKNVQEEERGKSWLEARVWALTSWFEHTEHHVGENVAVEEESACSPGVCSQETQTDKCQWYSL